MALISQIQTYQIFTNDDEVCITSLSSILIAALIVISKLIDVTQMWPEVKVDLNSRLIIWEF